jgi:Fis family transcriptional regulator, factor for inversion stimulation protein
MHTEFKGLVERLLGGGVSLEEATQLLERGMIQGALALNKGNHSAASKQLGIHRNTLQRKAVEYELEPKRARPRSRRKPVGREARARKRNTGVA